MKTQGLTCICIMVLLICTQTFAGYDHANNRTHGEAVDHHPEPNGSALVVSNATVRALLPGQNTTAAFFTLVNRGQSQCILLSADSPSAERIEFHTHQHQGDSVKMRALNQVKVPAGESLAFKSGGLHLMLFGVAPTLNGNKKGTMQLTLHTDQCGSVTVSATVVDIMTAPTHGADH